MASESEALCFDERGFEKSWCILPLGQFRTLMGAAFLFWSGLWIDERL